MASPARKLKFEGVVQEVGTIGRREGAAFTVETEEGTRVSKRAVSCLVEPKEGDRVLVASTSEGAYVLAVLERDPGLVEIAVEGDLRLSLPNGRFSVAAQEGVTLASSTDVSVVSGRFDVRAVDSEIAVERLTLVGNVLRAEVEKVKAFAQSLDTVVDRVTQRIKRSFRTVEELDQVRAKKMEITAQQTLSVHAHDTLMTAEQLVKIDGDQIHLG